MRSFVKLEIASSSYAQCRWQQNHEPRIYSASGSSPWLYRCKILLEKSYVRLPSSICCKFGNAVDIAIMALYVLTSSTRNIARGTTVVFAASLHLWHTRRIRIISSGPRHPKIFDSSSALKSLRDALIRPAILVDERRDCMAAVSFGFINACVIVAFVFFVSRWNAQPPIVFMLCFVARSIPTGNEHVIYVGTSRICW